MSQRIIFLENELELINIKNILTENQIPFEVRRITDSGFPELVAKDKIEIIIPESFSYTFFNLTEKSYDSRLVQTEEKKQPSFRLWPYLVLLYAVIITLLFVRQKGIIQRDNMDKNFYYEWDSKVTSLFQKDKKTKQVYSIYFDKNRDGNFEKLETYLKGKKCNEFYDRDENGRYEKAVYFSTNGKQETLSIDHDNDDLYDEITISLENGKVIYLVDKNKNGSYEQKTSK